MSYRQSFHKRIGINWSCSGSVGCSCGKSVRYNRSGTEYEDVQVNINVETTPFDKSITDCNNTVKNLTDSVVLTQTAQISSINNNSKKVASKIIDGFFQTIHSEISQQIAELSSILDSHLAYLNSIAKRCVEKQVQMKNDYQRIANRYLKIFGDLDKELSNRIYELDKSAFIFKQQSETHEERTITGNSASTVAVFGAEGGRLQAELSASIAKKCTLDTIGKANIFLLKQKRLNEKIAQTILDESVTAVKYSPICFIETQNEKNQIDKNLYQADSLPKMQLNEMITNFQTKTWEIVSQDTSEKIERYFNAEISNRYSAGDVHTNRVRDNVIKLLNFNQLKSI